VLTLTVILALALQVPPQAPSTAGSLVGCASDTTMQRLPGVFVVAKSAGVQRTTTADTSGCYEFRDLPTGSYRVTVRLMGFNNATRDGVTIAPAVVGRLDVTMSPSPICECVRLGGTTLAEQWDHADAVLHVRLSASEQQPTTPVDYYRHAAAVLNVLKKPGSPLTAPVFVLQNQRSEAPGPYDIDQEFVMFLKSRGSGGFAITNDEFGGDAAIVFLIQSGRIQRAPSGLSRYVGMPLDAFLGELRALSRGR